MCEVKKKMSYGASKQIRTAVSKLQISYSTTELWKHNGRGCWIQTSDARFKALCLKSTWLIPYNMVGMTGFEPAISGL